MIKHGNHVMEFFKLLSSVWFLIWISTACIATPSLNSSESTLTFLMVLVGWGYAVGSQTKALYGVLASASVAFLAVVIYKLGLLINHELRVDSSSILGSLVSSFFIAMPVSFCMLFLDKKGKRTTET